MKLFFSLLSMRFRLVKVSLQIADSLLQTLLTQDSELEKPLRDLGILPPGKSPLDKPLRLLADLVQKSTTPKSGHPPRWKGKLQETVVIRTALNAGPGCTVVLPVAWLLVRERVGDLSYVPQEVQDLLSYQGFWRMGASEVIFFLARKTCCGEMSASAMLLTN